MIVNCTAYYLSPRFQRLLICLAKQGTSYSVEPLIGPDAKIVTEYSGAITKPEKETEFSSPAVRVT